MFIKIKHQAELEGRHSQARAWERDMTRKYKYHFNYLLFCWVAKSATQPTRLEKQSIYAAYRYLFFSFIHCCKNGGAS
jgi:hypothetical protein